MGFTGDDRTRTDDLMLAKHTFYHLNYTPPLLKKMVSKRAVHQMVKIKKLLEE